MYSAASGKRYSRLATLVFVGVPHTRIPRCQAVLLDIGRETRVVTKVLGGATVIGTVTHTDRVVVENSGVTVRAEFIRARGRYSCGHNIRRRSAPENVSRDTFSLTDSRPTSYTAIRISL